MGKTPFLNLELKKGVFFAFAANGRKGEFKSAQLLELLENIHSPQLENLKKRRPQPFGTLSFALKISRLLRPYGAAGRIRTADLILTKGDFPLIYTKSNHKYNVNGIQAGGYTVAMNPRSQA